MINMFDFKWYLFNAAELVAPHLANPLYVSTISSPFKQFIEWLFQYIAPGRLCPWPPVIPTYRHLFCAFLSSNWTYFWITCSLIWALACSIVWRLLGLAWPCFTCCIWRSIFNKLYDKLYNSLFNCAREGPLPCAIVLKKVTRLTPFCQQAFDVVNIWVKANIRSRSTQAQDPLNCPTCLTKFHLFPH